MRLKLRYANNWVEIEQYHVVVMECEDKNFILKQEGCEVVTVDEVEKLHKVLAEAQVTLKMYIEESGGCDHSVGICMCTEVNLLDQIDSILKGAK